MDEAGRLIGGALLFGLCFSFAWLAIDYLDGRPIRSDHFMIFVVASVSWGIGRVGKS